MKLIGLMPVRNEAWVLGLGARVALTWCDALVILEHACTDDTRSHIDCINSEYPGRVHYMQIGAEWDEMKHRQAMLDRARFEGATHIAMIDADEVLCGIPPTQARQMVESIGSRRLIVPLYNLRNGINQYHANGLWGNRIVSLAFQDAPQLHWGGNRFHQREPLGQSLHAFAPLEQGEGGVMHLWGASERRLIAKHALYKVTERLRWPAKDVRQIEFQYSQCVKGGLREDPATWTYQPVPEEWWAPHSQWMKYLDVDAEPWQEQAVRDAVAEHGRAMFAGLDLFGVS